MKFYSIDYNTNLLKKKEVSFEINNQKIHVWLIPINHYGLDKSDKKSNWDYLSDFQIEQLNNLLYKKEDSCFYHEIKSYDSFIINESTISTNYYRSNTGNLIIFDNNYNIIGYLSYQFVNSKILIQNVCMTKKYRGVGFFKIIFNWFLREINVIYSSLKDKNYIQNFNGFSLTVWKESPFNINNQIVEIYKKFGFVFDKNENYSDKRTYIHMIKNLN